MAKVRIVSFGCSNNIAEGEMMAGLLYSAGHEIVEQGEEILVINLCTVKGPSINKGLRLARKSSARIIFAGCIPKGEVDNLLGLKAGACLINTHNIHRIVEAVENIQQGKQVSFLDDTKEPKLSIPRKRKNNVISIIPISSGCVSSCNYCIVKTIKGTLLSYSIESIMNEVRASLGQGCRELWITAQDTGCYGMDINTNLPELLKTILSIEGDYKIRLGMANPDFIHKHLDELIKLFKHDNIFKFLHIPVQSGSDKILKDMNRNYSIEEYKKIVSEFRKAIPEITISTDVILGYPTETRNDFEATLKLIKETVPDILNVNRYWSMQGTPASNLKSLPSEILKQRSLETVELFEKIAMERNKQWLGWSGKILIDEKGKTGTFMGRNFAYKPVIIKGDFNLGDEINVKIEDTNEHYLLASMD